MTQHPDWDGKWVRVVDPAANAAEPLGIVQLHRVYAVELGRSSDEAIDGHPPHGKACARTAAHQVINFALGSGSCR